MGVAAFPGHVDLKTTQIWARTNLEMKRNALNKINESSPVQMIPCWQQTRTYLTGSVLWFFVTLRRTCVYAKPGPQVPPIERDVMLSPPK